MLLALALNFILFGIYKATGEEDDHARFHHIHLNVVDPSASLKFYQKYFSAVPVKYRGAADVVMTDRSFIFFNKVDSPAPSELKSSIYHMGWGGIDGPAEYEWRKKEGVQFETQGTPLGTYYYMYAYGPDKELIEVWTQFHHNRFGHVHLLSDDVNKATQWYIDNLGLKGSKREIPKPPPQPADFKPTAGDMSMMKYLWMNQVSTDGVTINIFGKPGPEKTFWWQYEPLKELVKTDGRVIDHIAFSFRKIEPVLERMKQNGVEIVQPISEKADFKMKSFFVRGPDGILIEVVEEKPLPDGIWD